jgi:hypothetical protein
MEVAMKAFDNFDREDKRILSRINRKPYRFYSLTDLLPKTDDQLSANQDLINQFEIRLNQLNESRIIYKVAIEAKTYYFSPKAEND